MRSAGEAAVQNTHERKTHILFPAKAGESSARHIFYSIVSERASTRAHAIRCIE